MDIEVGEQVRTNDGYLGKLIAINKQDYNYLVVDTGIHIRKDEYPTTYLYLKNENIAKHSRNIIDLIEVGDFVNGIRIASVNNGNISFMEENEGQLYDIPATDIKTILTHEQYERNCYRLEE